jgi:hypothetical protein
MQDRSNALPIPSLRLSSATPDGPKKIFACAVLTGEADNFPRFYGNEAGNRVIAERDVALALPGSAERIPHPLGNPMLFV